MACAAHRRPDRTATRNRPYADPNEAKLRQDADAFFKTAVSTIRNSKPWTGNSVIFVVADDGDACGRRSLAASRHRPGP